jgi:hypothetical protein
MFPELTEEQMEYVAAAIRRALVEHGAKGELTGIGQAAG